MHFLRSLVLKKLKKEGFVINQFKRVPNLGRPSEEKIKQARKLIRLHRDKIDLFKKILTPKTSLDSALVVLKESRKPKFIDYIYKRNVAYDKMISFDLKVPFLDFENYLSIIYVNQYEEENYLKTTFRSKKRTPRFQTSSIVLLNGKAEITNSGILVNPKAIFHEGYWGFESFANMLPLDYQSLKE